jgi:hypothetical protein
MLCDVGFELMILPPGPRERRLIYPPDHRKQATFVEPILHLSYQSLSARICNDALQTMRVGTIESCSGWYTQSMHRRRNTRKIRNTLLQTSVAHRHLVSIF